VLLLSYALLLIVVWVNRRLSGMALIGLGLALNLLVMLVNGGYMPISPEALSMSGHTELATQEPGVRLASSKDVLLLTTQTRLWFLSDILVIPPPFPLPTVFSLGDAVIAVGAFWLTQRAMLGQLASAG
jgi:hypothetical protein